MIRIILVALAFLFLLGGALLIDSGERKGVYFFFFTALLLGMVAGIAVCKGPAVDEKTRKLLFW